VKQLFAAEIGAVDETAGLINNKPGQNQTSQDDKNPPRRCVHALVSLTGPANRVKLTDEKSGKPEKGGDAIAHFGEKRARNSSGLLGSPLAYQSMCVTSRAF
jgi:hypothetical protein